MRINIGSRNSRLALIQTNWVLNEIKKHIPNAEFNIKEIISRGDKLVDQDLSLVGGKGLFTAELESMLLEGTIDLAVHSLKDMPTELPEGLEVLCVPKREDARDMLVTVDNKKLSDLKTGAIVGTSSLRRSAQILMKRPDIQVKLIRGNVDTRLKKLNSGLYDATLLAVAGLKRLGIFEQIQGEVFNVSEFLPAAGQGALAIEVNTSNKPVIELLKHIHDEDTYQCVKAERDLLNRFGGGCNSPLGIYAELNEGIMSITCIALSKDGEDYMIDSEQGSDSKEIVSKLYERMIKNNITRFLSHERDE